MPRAAAGRAGGDKRGSVTVVIAQLTDSHLRRAGEFTHGFDTGRCLQDAVQAIVDAPVPIDAIVVTGDLADRGREDEYRHFLEITAPIRAPIYPGPGNHDEARTLAKAFASAVDVTHAGDVAYSVDVGPLRIVMLDSSIAGADHGSMSAERLRWLDDTLSLRPSQPTLLAMHHPPFRTGIRHMDAINCHDGDALAELLLRHRQVLALACGHVHRSIFTSFAGRAASVAPSPAYAVCLDFAEDSTLRFTAEPAGLHLHVWAPEGGPFGTLATHRVSVNAPPVVSSDAKKGLDFATDLGADGLG